jgi:hypothetical protein
MKIIILMVAIFFSRHVSAQTHGTKASLTSAQLMQALQMDSVQYTGFRAQMKLFADSINVLISDTTLSKQVKQNSVALINAHQHTYLQASLTPAQLAAYTQFEQSRAVLSPRRKNE